MTAPKAESRAWVLPAAAGLATLETTALIAILALRSPPWAPLAIAMLLVKYPFCYLVVRRSAGALLGLMLWEVAGMAAALTRPAPLAVRLLELTVATTVLVLLIAAVPLFPSVQLPSSGDR